jgi:hypothetical protein
MGYGQIEHSSRNLSSLEKCRLSDVAGRQYERYVIIIAAVVRARYLLAGLISLFSLLYFFMKGFLFTQSRG